MVKIGEKHTGELLFQPREIVVKELSDDLCILFLEDDNRRYYYVPSYDWGIAAKKGEPLDLKEKALSVLPYFQAFIQEYNEKTKEFYYPSDAVGRATWCLNQRIQKILDQAEKEDVYFEDWKTVECRILESLKRQPIMVS